MAFTVSMAYTPSVTPEGVTAPPTQGSLFSVPFGPASISTAQASEADGRGMPRPYKPSPEDLQKIEDYTPSVMGYGP